MNKLFDTNDSRRTPMASGTAETDAQMFARLYGNQCEARYSEPSAVWDAPAPRISSAAEALGKETTRAWLVSLITDLAFFCGAQRTDAHQYGTIADAILAKYSHLTAAEMLYFFAAVKSGDYGQLYGRIDGQQLLAALRAFVQGRRAEELDKRAKAARKVDDDRWNNPDGISMQQYVEEKMARGEHVSDYLMRLYYETLNQ